METQGSKGEDTKVKAGCYLIRLQPETRDPDVLFFEGTIRVVHKDHELLAGGDLYCRLRSTDYPRGYPWAAQPGDDKPTTPVTDIDKLPEPKRVIPVFNRADYRAYLQVRSIQESVPAQGQVTVFFDAHYFEADARRWPQPGSRMLILSRSKEGDKYEGNVLDQDTGRKIGKVVVHYLSDKLRRARVLLCTTTDPEVHAPDKVTFENAFRNIQWDLTTEPKTTRRPQPESSPGNRPWTIAELHEALQELRTADAAAGNPDDVLDREWLYYLLCVPDIEGYARGVMFDTYGGDSKNVPREAAAIGGHWVFEDKDPWGRAKNKPLQELTAVYARVAVHELGHAMGLDHNHHDDGLMNTTDAIAENAWNRRQQKIDDARKKAFDQILDAISKGNGIKEAVVAEKIDQAVEDDYWRQEYSKRPYVTQGAPYEDYQPAYRTGYEGYASHPGKTYEEVEADLQLAYERPKGDSRLEWEKAKYATRDAWHRVAEFPGNVKHDFHADDCQRLQLGPDIAVRPGTTYENGGPFFADAATYRADGLDLEVMPLLDTVPLGAPVRIGLRLHNTNSTPEPVPVYLNLGSGVVSGTVTALATGEIRTFWPLKRPLDADPQQILNPGQFSRADSLTLLRGAQGALFPMAGDYRIQVTVAWERGGTRVLSEGDTTVRISSAVDDAHLAVANQLINTPDILLNLALGGHVKTKEGQYALAAALNNPILRPHYAVIPAKKALTRHFETPPTLEVSREIKADIVLSIAEIKSLAALIAENMKASEEKLDAKARAEIEEVTEILTSKVSHLVSCGRVASADGGALKREIQALSPKQSRTPISSA